MNQSRKKTPKDATDFEREQLRFLLTREDLVPTLVELNPSLAWLPVLNEMNLLNQGAKLAPWIEQNFSDPNAVRDVAANMHFFDAETANLLEYRLNEHEARLPAYLTKSWRLIVRHMRSMKRGMLRNEWFEIAPRIRRGENSPEILERLSDALRPKLEVGRRLSWSKDESSRLLERPSDLMAIDYEVEDGLTEEEVLSVWPSNASAQTEERLLHLLTISLSAALEDAIDAGVESNRGYGVSDTDVPSVAAHGQNAHRTGFQPIVRVTAEIWTRLANRETNVALPFVSEWIASSYRLVRRLALFAATNPNVPISQAVAVLIALPQGELFLTNSSVEAYRLLKSRWLEMPSDERAELESKIIKGPPGDWFREGSNVERQIDRSRFDLLGSMVRWALPLGQSAKETLQEIQARWPQWLLRDAEQTGFHIWRGPVGIIQGKPDRLEGIADDDLVGEAERIARTADFMDGDTWQTFCQTHPVRALNGLEADARKGQWRGWAWTPFLWATKSLDDASTLSRIARLLLQYPSEYLVKIVSSASWWLNEKAEALDAELLWPLWDRIEGAAVLAREEVESKDE